MRLRRIFGKWMMCILMFAFLRHCRILEHFAKIMLNKTKETCMCFTYLEGTYHIVPCLDEL